MGNRALSLCSSCPMFLRSYLIVSDIHPSRWWRNIIHTSCLLLEEVLFWFTTQQSGLKSTIKILNISCNLSFPRAPKKSFFKKIFYQIDRETEAMHYHLYIVFNVMEALAKHYSHKTQIILLSFISFLYAYFPWVFSSNHLFSMYVLIVVLIIIIIVLLY